MQAAKVLQGVEELVDAWCERRCLRALGFVLQGFPLGNLHTDGWGELLMSLRKAQGFAGNEMTASERERLNALIVGMDSWRW